MEGILFIFMVVGLSTHQLFQEFWTLSYTLFFAKSGLVFYVNSLRDILHHWLGHLLMSTSLLFLCYCSKRSFLSLIVFSNIMVISLSNVNCYKEAHPLNIPHYFKCIITSKTWYLHFFPSHFFLLFVFTSFFTTSFFPSLSHVLFIYLISPLFYL